MKLLFIPSWNGHLYLNEYTDNSISKLYEEVEGNKELVEVVKNNIEETEKNIVDSFNKYDRVLSITGDHSNSYPLIKEFAKKNPNFKLVIFDAHPDVEVNDGKVSHEDYLRSLIEEGVIDPKNIYLFGIRMFSRLEFDYLNEKGVNYFHIKDILLNKDKIKEILSSIDSPVYLSVDIDVLDPDDAPGTYYAEYCGLYIDELVEFISLIKEKVVSSDITEYYAEKDKDDVTKKSVLKLINTFLN